MAKPCPRFPWSFESTRLHTSPRRHFLSLYIYIHYLSPSLTQQTHCCRWQISHPCFVSTGRWLQAPWVSFDWQTVQGRQSLCWTWTAIISPLTSTRGSSRGWKPSTSVPMMLLFVLIPRLASPVCTLTVFIPHLFYVKALKILTVPRRGRQTERMQRIDLERGKPVGENRWIKQREGAASRWEGWKEKSK